MLPEKPAYRYRATRRSTSTLSERPCIIMVLTSRTIRRELSMNLLARLAIGALLSFGSSAVPWQERRTADLPTYRKASASTTLLY